ncbi:MAG TPA: RsmD family RNA methyltransferase [Gemmatimonadaceae bacterium]|nr:RsmD family RNA methyltransferase [Gemmatimonadaceae bacterium]
MRIVAGKWRGRRIDPPPDERVRPTGDRVREAWMSIVNPWLAGARVLDLFSGSGALGFEALSRAAAVVDFVDASATSIAAIRKNAEALGAGAGAQIHRADALGFAETLEAHAYDVAFADPPYDLGLATRVAERWLDVPFADILGIEHRVNEQLPGDGERRKYGNTVITLYRSP